MNDINYGRRIDDENYLNICAVGNAARDIEFLVLPLLGIRRPCVTHDIFRFSCGDIMFSDVFPIGIVPSEFQHGDYLTTKFGPTSRSLSS